VKTSLSRQTIGTGILLQQAQHTIWSDEYATGGKRPWEPTLSSLWDGGARGEQARETAGCGELERAGSVSGWEAQTRIPDTRSAYEYRTWTTNPWEASTSGTGKRIKSGDDNWWTRLALHVC
jgi:hypothetical protein